MATPFDNEVLMNWFIDAFPLKPCKESVISTVGSNPISEDKFDYVLRCAGWEVYCPSENTDVLIIGQEDWDEDDLNGLLDEREGQHLRIYSQEMFLAHWLSGQDPFDEEEIARAFAENHPALEFLSNRWLTWPSTFVAAGTGRLLLDSPEVGMLRHMGYRVGEKALPVHERHVILAEVFSSQLPHINSLEYMQEWGKPKSKERLRKIANSLAAFCQSQKRRGNLLAASDYEDDLRWLRQKYYHGRFKFQWPRVYVGSVRTIRESQQLRY